MNSTVDSVSTLKLEKKLINKLISKDIMIINDLWKLRRKDLKNLGFSDREIKDIIISLELNGLDLGKKIYD
jgi:hypothetical protein